MDAVRRDVMKILLVAPIKENYAGLAQFPPLGLGYVASALRASGYRDVNILDCVLEGLSLSGFEERLKEMKPDVVGINSWSVSVREVDKSLKIAKALNRETVTVIGGPHPSALGERCLTDFPEADYAFRGEAEIGAPLLMDFISGKGASKEDIPGLMWREAGGEGREGGAGEAEEAGRGACVAEGRTAGQKAGGGMTIGSPAGTKEDVRGKRPPSETSGEGFTIRSNPQAFEKDLDRFSFPSWDLIRPDRYARAGTLIQKKTACIVTTRGCPFPCTFCSASITAGKAVRTRSVGNILSEIKLLYTDYGIRRLVVFDENITMRKPHIMAFCSAVIKEALDVSFELPNGIRLDTLDMEVLTAMKKAGFSERVAVGIESGSDRVLKLMKKGLTKEEIREKVGLLKAAGFRPIGYFIVGFPGETREEVEETVNFAIELKLYRAGFMPFHPLPGTESYEQLLKRGELPEDFDFSLLSTDNIVYAPEGMTRKELEEMRRRAILRFNLRPRVMWDYLRDYNSAKFMVKKLKSVFFKKRTAEAGGTCQTEGSKTTDKTNKPIKQSL